MMNNCTIKCAGIKASGFTLVEVLIAMVVAAIGLLGVLGMIGHAVKGNVAGSNYTRATFLAQGILERMKNGEFLEDKTFGYMDMSNTKPGIVKQKGAMAGVDEKCNIGGPFHVQWQVAANTQWSRTIRVSVTWDSVFGKTREVTLTTISRGNATE